MNANKIRESNIFPWHPGCLVPPQRLPQRLWVVDLDYRPLLLQREEACLVERLHPPLLVRFSC